MPQVVIQTLYISMYQVDAVAIISTLFSSISIIVTVLTMFTQKSIMKKQSFMVIEFEVNGVGLKRGMERRANRIERWIAMILDAPLSSVDMEQGHFLSSGGFQLHIEVDVNKDESADYKKLIQEVIDNGSMADIFKKYWKVPKVPYFTNLRCDIVSKNVEMGMFDMLSGGKTAAQQRADSASGISSAGADCKSTSNPGYGAGDGEDTLDGVGGVIMTVGKEEIERNQEKTQLITNEHDAGNVYQETVHCE